MSYALITKTAIAKSLEQLCANKSFDKIKIDHITEVCGLNRQIFYYHFFGDMACIPTASVTM